MTWGEVGNTEERDLKGESARFWKGFYHPSLIHSFFHNLQLLVQTTEGLHIPSQTEPEKGTQGDST